MYKSLHLSNKEHDLIRFHYKNVRIEQSLPSSQNVEFVEAKRKIFALSGTELYIRQPAVVNDDFFPYKTILLDYIEPTQEGNFTLYKTAVFKSHCQECHCGL